MTCPDVIRVGDWRAIRATGELERPGGTQRLEPKVADLLFLLAACPGEALGRERIVAALWPGQVVGDDSLARAVFKLRQALGDDAKSPRYIETLSKRGYRLIADVATEVSVADRPAAAAGAQAQVVTPPVPPASPAQAGARPRRTGVLFAMVALAAVAGAWWVGASRSTSQPGGERAGALATQADDFYFQFSRADNESAIELYERVLGLEPDNAHALAGLANALVQRSIRWPDLPGTAAVQFTRLEDALANGHLARAPASLQLMRARRLAERAAALAPRSSPAHKAVGFVAGAQGRFEDALAAYDRAIHLDPDAWGSLINIGDVLEITGRRQEALPYFERAYAAMERGYARNPVQIRPWHAQLGALVAQRHAARGDRSAAEAWYRRVLGHSPLHADATRGLAGLLREAGDGAEADRLCAELDSRVGTGAGASCRDAGRTATRPD